MGRKPVCLMKLIKLSNLSQSYSFLEADRPNEVWAVATSPNREPGGVHGIPLHIIEKVTEESDGWCGWGFGEGQSFLLFEKQEDALLATVSLGLDHV